MNSRELFNLTLNHRDTGKAVIDFGATPVTGIHVLVVERLRKYFGLSDKPVKVVEPYQMLGEIDAELQQALGVDIIGLSARCNMFGIPNENWREMKMHWGQVVLVPGSFNTTTDNEGNLLIHPEGDLSVPPSARMPRTSYFFDAIIRQEPIDEEKLDVSQNLEEFGQVTDSDLLYWKNQLNSVKDTEKGVIVNFGGTGLGDIALVPAMNLKHPKGIRDVAEWYMSTVMRTDYVHAIFEKQTEIAIHNLTRYKEIAGDLAQAIFICGTDFGTQDSTFCSPETFNELYAPYYRKINNWIHKNTRWSTFKHSCGAVEPFMELFIDAGFDIINPVQINATGMNPVKLKEKYGDRLVFWGGGVDTQKILPFGTPAEVEDQVLRECEIFTPGGGFVFNTVHNIQANTPVENLVAMINALRKFNGEKTI